MLLPLRSPEEDARPFGLREASDLGVWPLAGVARLVGRYMGNARGPRFVAATLRVKYVRVCVVALKQGLTTYLLSG